MMPEQSRASRMSSRVLPFVADRVFHTDWMTAGDNRAALAAAAKKRRVLDGPRPDAILQRKWGRATTEIGGRSLHLLTPKGGTSGRVLFYCHGGAFVIGPSSLEWIFAARFAASIGCDLALYDYPRVPEADSPTILATTLAAYRVIEARYPPRHITMAGLSAGGGLAVATLLQLQRVGSPLPSAGVLFSPWLDVTVSHPDAEGNTESDLLLPIERLRRDGELYAGATELTDPLVSPRFASADDLAAMPPMVVSAGEHEILLPEAREFVANLTGAGVTAKLALEPHGQHGGIAGAHPEAAAGRDECVEFLRACRRRQILLP